MFNPLYKSSIRYTFNIQCPNMDNQLTLSLLNDATVPGGVHFYDVCKVVYPVNIAYNNYKNWFEVDSKTHTLVELEKKPIKGWNSYIPRDWEIIKPFLDQYTDFTDTSTWEDCDYTWGVLDQETGTWTGCVGKVRNCKLQFMFY